MRQSREVKAETHQAIVAEAARMFRERGIDGTSVGDVMKAADKTHGGFYRHFDSKESLLVAALENAFVEMRTVLDEGLARGPRADAQDRFLGYYLSPAMVDDVGGGCPVAALAGDAQRSNDGVRTVFGTGARALIDALAETLDGPADDRVQRAARIFAMAAGAVMIARASDPDTAAMILHAARAGGTAPASAPDGLRQA